MKKILKIVFVVILFSCIISILGNQAMAYDWGNKIDSTLENSLKYDTSEASKAVENLAGSVITVVNVIASGIAIIMLMVLAIKYIMASPGDRADIKKHAVVYLVGAVILFSVVGILTILQNFALGF